MKKIWQLHCDYCFKTFDRYFSAMRNNKNKYCSLDCSYEHKKVEGIKSCSKLLKYLDDDFLNWFSGFWEGEGSLVTISKNRNTPSPRFTLYQSDLTVMKYIRNKFNNIAHITKQTKNGKLSKRDGYVFQTGKFGECVLFAYILKSRIKSNYKKQQLSKWINKFKMKKYFKYLGV